MKIKQFILQRTFIINHKNKNYYINYLNSDGQILGLINRENWQILDENSEELQINLLSNSTKKERKEIEENRNLFDVLIRFCIKHFEDYNPIKNELGV